MKLSFSFLLSCILSSCCSFVLLRPFGFVKATLSATSRAQIGLNPLPYDYAALEPYVSSETLRIHHDKHHQRYVSNTLGLIKGTDLEFATIEEIMRHASANKNQNLFNNAGQCYNHEFYWHSMKSGGSGRPTGVLANLIDRDFGSFDNFKTEFVKAGMGVFGSGWTWLVINSLGKLQIVQTSGADCPLISMPGSTSLLTMDVWEHAYYVDYRNLRDSYCNVFVDHLVDWDAAAARLPSSHIEL